MKEGERVCCCHLWDGEYEFREKRDDEFFCGHSVEASKGRQTKGH